MPERKKQHYISVFYLHRFTIEREGRKKGSNSNKEMRDTDIFFYDKKNKKIKKKAIKNLCFASYLFSYKDDNNKYVHDLDDSLQKVEEDTKNCLCKLDVIAGSFKQNKSESVEVDDVILEKIIEFMIWQLRRNPELVETVLKKTKEIFKGVEGVIADKEALSVIGRLGSNQECDVAPILAAKNQVIYFTKSTKFITTDTPVVRFNPSALEDIREEATEIYFPLASNMLLVLYGKGNKKNFHLLNDRKRIKEINIYMAKKARNHVFGSTKEHLESIVGCIL
ncbi:conserved hypothetical protein [Bathymodiolus platifrons methanotrophic gill symbiont]|uniref:DUF4238 domain-containing protein n=1 Tax=Bathymodiolus platifrons methanotrophic gill symbiont TaxID=113268 RepID=UPI000B40D203|nr:DUF4238 domain-containing protein [Bathymodiolus platifrons methanotrophic gill symbiont]GAW87446.1 conserved hypothetical protein [Bathymodiolus platifrons methanotrophic gill symbiont]